MYPQIISKIKSFIGQYIWKDVDFTSHSTDWKKFGLNNKSIALNILFIPYITDEIRLAYKSKYNFKRKSRQVILLMITDGKKWHYLAVKSLPGLFRKITSNHNGDLYYLNCFHSCNTKNRLKNIKNYAMILIIVM